MQPDQIPETRERIPGHGLLHEGRAFDRGRVKVGVGICVCGERSPVLQADAARQRWHRQHKAAVLAQRAGP